MNDDVIEVPEVTSSGRRTLFRDLVVFQVKLVVDGFRDLLLVPLSLLTASIGLIRGGQRPGNEFYGLLRLGYRSERWINLFGALEPRSASDDGDDSEDFDRLAARIEDFIVDEYRDGRLTRQARERLDRALHRLQAAARRSD